MITPTNDRKLISSGSMSSVKFGITKNPAKIIRLLRDSVYEDKELATIREVYCNAQDSHNRAGKHDVACLSQPPRDSQYEFGMNCESV